MNYETKKEENFLVQFLSVDRTLFLKHSSKLHIIFVGQTKFAKHALLGQKWTLL